MAYPSSSDVVANNQANASEYNNLRKDAMLDYVEIAPPGWTSPAGPGAFENWDLSGSLPADALLAEILIKTLTLQAGAITTGVRKNGSALNRYVALDAADPNAQTDTVCMTWTVELDAGRIVERYSSDVSQSDFTVIGYWTRPT